MVRSKIRNHPRVRAAMLRFWDTFQKDVKYGIMRDTYVQVTMLMCKALYKKFNEDEAKKIALGEWKRDTGNKVGLDQESYLLSLFELVDIWTTSVDPLEYEQFLVLLYNRITNRRHLKKTKDFRMWKTLGELRPVELTDDISDLMANRSSTNTKSNSGTNVTIHVSKTNSSSNLNAGKASTTSSSKPKGKHSKGFTFHNPSKQNTTDTSNMTVSTTGWRRRTASPGMKGMCSILETRPMCSTVLGSDGIGIWEGGYG